MRATNINEVPLVLTTEEAAQLLNVSVNVVKHLAGKGKVPALKVGREWRFYRDALLGTIGWMVEERRAREVSKEKTIDLHKINMALAKADTTLVTGLRYMNLPAEMREMFVKTRISIGEGRKAVMDALAFSD